MVRTVNTCARLYMYVCVMWLYVQVCVCVCFVCMSMFIFVYVNVHICERESFGKCRCIHAIKRIRCSDVSEGEAERTHLMCMYTFTVVPQFRVCVTRARTCLCVLCV